MGPRSFDRGRHAFASTHSSHRASFNGASVFRPRKAFYLHRVCVRDYRFNGASVFRPRKEHLFMARGLFKDQLQWGLGLSTEEGSEFHTKRNR